MQVYQCSNTNHPLFLTNLKGSYDVRRIWEALSAWQTCYLPFSHAISAWLWYFFFSEQPWENYPILQVMCRGYGWSLGVFLDLQATKNAVIGGGFAIFKYMYNVRGTTCTMGEIWYNILSLKAAGAGLIKPESIRPTEGAAAQQSLCAYLQTWDWMLSQGMSVYHSEYGWTVGIHGFKPVPSLDHGSWGIAPFHYQQACPRNLDSVYSQYLTLATRSLCA